MTTTISAVGDSGKYPPLLTTSDLARITGLSREWFAHRRWKIAGEGPPYVKIGRAVRYRLEDVIAWIEGLMVRKAA